MSSKVSSIQEFISNPAIKVVLVALNIRSAYNVGAMFRTADGTGQTAIVIAGYTPTPENPKVAKTALGAEYSVPWCYVEDVGEILKEQKLEHVGLELTPKAVDLFAWEPSTEKKTALYVGNEVTGLPVELMTNLEIFVQLPMKGEKASLNVAEATSIALYEFLRKVTSQ